MACSITRGSHVHGGCKQRSSSAAPRTRTAATGTKRSRLRAGCLRRRGVAPIWVNARGGDVRSSSLHASARFMGAVVDRADRLEDIMPEQEIGGHRRPPAITGRDTGPPGGLCTGKQRGLRYPANPPTVEEFILVMREAGTGPYADRARGLIAILWRAGLRIREALDLTETDLDARTGPSTGSSCPVGPLFCVLAGPTRGADGQQQLRAVSFAASLPRLAYGGGSHHTSRGMLTRSRWRTKGSRCRLSRGSSACTPRDHVDLPPGNRYARDRRHCAPPPATGDPGERRPAAITGPEGRVVGAWRAPCSSPASGRRPHSGRALPVLSASGSLGGGRGRQPGAASKGSSQ